MKKAIALLILLSQFISVSFAEPRIRPSDWAVPVIGTEIGNFYKVSNKVYRSQQPDDEDVKDINSLGIGTILNLRNYHTDDDEFRTQPVFLKRVKMDAGSVTEDQLLQALKIIKESKTPVLVHCWHGSDRTGVVIAAYRIVFEDWPKNKAIDEFKNGGYGYHFRVYPNLPKLLESLDVDSFKNKLDI